MYENNSVLLTQQEKAVKIYNIPVYYAVLCFTLISTGAWLDGIAGRRMNQKPE